MKPKYAVMTMAMALAAAGFLGAAGYGLYAAGLQRGIGMKGGPATATAVPTAPTSSSPTEALPQGIAQGEAATRRHIAAGIKAGDVDPATGRKVLYYHDPMVPATRFDKPARSPFMDMMLVPVYADGGGGGGGDGGNGGAVADASQVTVSPRIQQSLGVRTALVSEGAVSPQLSVVGNIAFNERDQVVVQARANGYVERLNVRAMFDRVAKGQPLAELYVPDWIAAQEEFLALRRMQGSDLAPLVEGARLRMRQVGMGEAQIALIERSGRSQARMALLAPIGGVVTELLVREGMTVAPGATLFRINGLSTVWANAEVPESQAALLRPGAKVRAQVSGLTGAAGAAGPAFDGTVQALLPDVNPVTRTFKARVELANPNGALLPGMFVQMQFLNLRADTVLRVPTEAIIQTGRRTLAMLAEAGGRFRPVEVVTGVESGGQTEVRSGLQAGQRVVVSAQFLIDSEASLKGVEARLNAQPAPSGAAGSGVGGKP